MFSSARVAGMFGLFEYSLVRLHYCCCHIFFSITLCRKFDAFLYCRFLDIFHRMLVINSFITAFNWFITTIFCFYDIIIGSSFLLIFVTDISELHCIYIILWFCKVKSRLWRNTCCECKHPVTVSKGFSVMFCLSWCSFLRHDIVSLCYCYCICSV